MLDRPGPSVDLVAVDEAVLKHLVDQATADARADEVTPRLASDDDGWSAARVTWLRNFHRDRRLGLDGPSGEATWAIVADECVVGSVRLKRTDDPQVLETGVWLGRSARGRGVGRDVVAAVVRVAAALGAETLVAETTESNAAALRVLKGEGFQPGHPIRAATFEWCFVSLLRRPFRHPSDTSIEASWTRPPGRCTPAVE